MPSKKVSFLLPTPPTKKVGRPIQRPIQYTFEFSFTERLFSWFY